MGAPRFIKHRELGAKKIIEGLNPSLSHNSYALVYEDAKLPEKYSSTKLRLVGNNMSIDNWGSEFSFAEASGGYEVKNLQFCDEILSENECISTKKISQLVPVLKKKLLFYEGGSLNREDRFKCRHPQFMNMSNDISCRTGRSSGLIFSGGQSTDFKFSTREPSIDISYDGIRSSLLKPPENETNHNLKVLYNMSPGITKELNGNLEYKVLNRVFSLGTNSGSSCDFELQATNRFSQKNINLQVKESLGSFVVFNNLESAATDPSRCNLGKIDSYHFSFAMTFRVDGIPAGNYYLFQNADLGVGYFDSGGIRKVIIRLGWGKNTEILDFPLSSRVSAANEWHQLKVERDSDMVTLHWDGNIIGRQRLKNNKPIFLGNKLEIGPKFVSKGAKNIRLFVNSFEFRNIDDRRSVDQNTCSSQSAFVSEKRVLAVGDSITEGNRGYGGTWRRSLCNEFRKNGFNVNFVGSKQYVKGVSSCNDGAYCDFDSNHEGYSGQPSKVVFEKLSLVIDDFEVPDLVLIHLGTNDFRIWCKKSTLDQSDICENDEAISQDIVKNIEKIVLLVLEKNPNARFFVANNIPTNYGKIKVGSNGDGSNPNVDKSNQAVYNEGFNQHLQVLRQKLESWQNNINKSRGKNFVEIVDQYGAMAFYVDSEDDFDNVDLEYLYNDVLHPKGPADFSGKDMGSKLKVYGVDVMANKWLNSIQKYLQ
ncbi:MAG: SGNH/GDSL hydrolase family protein [Bdellovibrionales bacterium]